MVGRWTLLVILKAAIERVQRYAPQRDINPEDEERVERLAHILTQWVKGEPQDAREVFQRMCALTNTRPDAVRSAVLQ